MKIKLFGNLRQVAGDTEFEATGATLREVLVNLSNQHAALGAAILDDDGLRPHVRVMVNGHDCELAQGLETTVSDDDRIAVFPPSAGG